MTKEKQKIQHLIYFVKSITEDKQLLVKQVFDAEKQEAEFLATLDVLSTNPKSIPKVITWQA